MTNRRRQQIKPTLDRCAFCSSDFVRLEVRHTPGALWSPEYYVLCLDCPLEMGPFETEAEAVTAWNRRNGL